MKLLILLLTTNVIGGGTANSVVSYEQIKTEYTRAMMDVEKINLTTQKMNSVNVDLTYLSERESFTSEDIKEAVAVEIVVENSQYDWINDFLDSYLFNNNSSWSTIGINYTMPEANTSVDYKARLLPKYVEEFEGVMAINVTLTNGDSVTETPAEDKHISELITKTNLGEIEENDSKSIKDSILINNPKAKGNEFNIVTNSITEDSATISAVSGSGYTGDVVVNFSIADKIVNLSEDLKISNLGEIDLTGEGTTPVDKAELIKKLILDKNSKLTENDFDVHSVTETSAIAEAREGSKYKGKVEIKFTFKEKVVTDLSKLNGELGLIQDMNKNTILNKFIQLNKGSDIKVDDLIISNITPIGAFITPNNDDFTGSLNLNFKIKSHVAKEQVHNIKEDRRVDAGTAGWMWTTSEDSDVYQSPITTVNFNDEEFNYPNSLNHIVLSFDLTGSMVDTGDRRIAIENPIQELHFSEFKDQAGWEDKFVFQAKSQDNSDYSTGTYYISYKYDKDSKILSYSVMMKGYAFNGGNGLANTSGKGTNRLMLNTVKIEYRS